MPIKAKNTNSDYGVFLFLIWPFFAAIFAIRNYRAAWAKDLIWLFVAFFGFTLTIVATDADEKSDANRYRDKFVEMAATKVSFENVTSLFYDEESQVLDVLESLIIFVVSRVTDNYHVLFAVFGLIFGYFYSRNIWYLIERVKGKMASDNIPIILTFAFIVGFWEINGFRFWTATHIFLYGALPYLFEGKKSKIGFIILAVLMHFSYILPIGILGIHTALGKRTSLYFILFLLTFFIKELNLSQLGDFLSSNLPEILLPRVKSYVNEGYASDIVEVYANANWYVVWYQLALKWSVTVFIITIFVTGKKFLAANKNYETLFSFTLLMYSIANIFSLVPSGGRFISLSNLFAVAFIFFYIQYAPLSRAVKRIIPFALPALVLYSIVSLRIGIEAMGILCLVGNPILRVFINADITVLEVLKGTFKF
jgi:hypothetical protein